MSVDAAIAFAAALDRACSRALRGKAVATILHGSLTLGDYDDGASDIDLLVIAESVTDRDITAVSEATASLRPDAPAPVDVRIITRRTAERPMRTPVLDAYIRLPSSAEREIRVERLAEEPDLVVELSVCRKHGRSLSGPPAMDLIGEVPDEWVIYVGDAQLERWQAIGDDPPWAQLTVLTACRVWHFAEQRRHTSKAAAGRWALQRDPTLTVVTSALLQRTDETITIDPVEVQRLLVTVRERIASIL